MDNEMLERALKAAASAAKEEDEFCTKVMVIAIIKSLSEPTEEVKKVLNGAADWADGESSWEAGINAIIGDEQ